MPKIVLASGLARWLPDAGPGQSGERAIDVDGTTLHDALEHLFARYPGLRGYVLDELANVRHHVAVFIDGTVLTDKGQLQTPLSTQAEIYLLQALSGG